MRTANVMSKAERFDTAPPSPAAPSISLVPPAGLVTQPQTGDTPPLFCMFTQEWLTMQGFIGQALTLPIDVGSFQDKYGQFSDEAEIDGCIAAMKAIQNLSSDFGDPQALMAALAKDPAILQTDTPPAQLYTHIVWFATKLNQTATTFNQTLSQFVALLNPANCGNPAQCGAVLAEVLTGPGGLQSTAQSMVAKSNDLVQLFAQFSTKLTPSIQAMDTYTSESSKFLADVDAAITQDTTDEDTYQDEANKAYKLWRDLTISAVTTSVGVLLATGGLGWPASAVLAGVLGDQAAKARSAYDDAVDALHKSEEDERKKRILRLDLKGFNTQMAPTDQAAQDFLKTLQQVTAVWVGISSNLDFIVKNFTPEELGDLNFVMQALALDRATNDWKAIGDASQQYTTNSLVTLKIHKFGDPLPNS